MLAVSDDPDHTIAAFHVGASPLGAVVGLGRRSDRATRHRVAAHWRQRLAVLGYAAVLGVRINVSDIGPDNKVVVSLVD